MAKSGGEFALASATPNAVGLSAPVSVIYALDRDRRPKANYMHCDDDNDDDDIMMMMMMIWD